MKSVFYYLLSLVITVTGCEKIYTRPTNPAPPRDTFFLSVSPTDDIFFSDDGYAQSAQSVKINVTTNQWIWEVSSDQEWCRTYQNLIFNDSTFTVFVDSNTGPVARTATVTVTAEKVPPVHILVHQAASSLLDIDPSTDQTISENGGTIDIFVKSDTSWSATSNRTWAVVEPENGEKEGSVRVSIAPNPNRENDSATITFCAGAASKYLTIRRAENPNGSYITIDPTGIRKFPINGGALTVTIGSNESWSVSSDRSWVTAETDSGTGNGSTRLLVAPNTNNENQLATISFRAGTAYKELQIERDYIKYIRIKYIREGYSTRVAYTIDGKYIRKGHSSKVAYTIDGKYIREGHSSKVAYTLD